MTYEALILKFLCTSCVCVCVYYINTQLTHSQYNTTKLSLQLFHSTHTHTPPNRERRCSSLPYKVVHTGVTTFPFCYPPIIPTLLAAIPPSSFLPNPIGAKTCRHALSLVGLNEPATCSKRIGAIINGGGKFLANSSAFYNRFLSGHLISRVSISFYFYLS